MRRELALLVALLAAGCTSGPCARNSDCAAGLVCGEASACALPPDAAPGDGDSGDAADAAPDAPRDGALHDAAPDAPRDGAPLDAEPDAPRDAPPDGGP